MGTEAAYKQGAIDAYGPNVGKVTQGLVDKGAQAFVDGNIDRIVNDQTKTWAQKVLYLQDAKDGIGQTFDAYKKSPSNRQALDDKVAAALVEATTNAHKEAVSSDLGVISSLKLTLQDPHSAAKVGGWSFDPNDVRQVEDLKKTVKTKEGQDSLSSLIESLTVEADKGVTDRNRDKALSNNLDNARNFIQDKYRQGWTDKAVEQFVHDMLPGKNDPANKFVLDPRNWSEAIAFMGNARKLKDDEEVKAALSVIDQSKIPDEAKKRAAVALTSMIGGYASRKGEPNPYQKDGKWLPSELKNLAETMVKSEQEKAADTLVKKAWNGAPEAMKPGDLPNLIRKARKKEFATIVSEGDVEKRFKDFADTAWSELSKGGKYDRSQVKSVEYNLLSAPGLPTFVFTNGDEATPDVDASGNLIFNWKSHQTNADRARGAKK